MREDYRGRVALEIEDGGSTSVETDAKPKSIFHNAAGRSVFGL
ncbi:hypothetical protein [Pseudaminobacter soli (ex Li et al. 2025)]|nr:hypothetical protein [Mesorhizobium soli]